jgi:predicted nucleic acid-binding Zn ribbon protein
MECLWCGDSIPVTDDDNPFCSPECEELYEESGSR